MTGVPLAEQPTSYLPWVGQVAFPRTPADLTSTSHCPACFTALTATTCSVCGLDVSNPAVVELHDASVQAAALLERRLEVIGRIRYETAQAATPVVAPAVVAAAPVAAPPAAVPVAVPVADAVPRRHLGVQVVLLIVAVSLLSVGAIFFLVYAFITFGLVWRSVIILAVTIACFVGASLLKRRQLGATAEGIAALAVVFVYLDAFALRANNLFGADSAEPLVYWGIVLLVSAVGFAVWHRVAGLRIPNLVAFTAAAPGLALLVAGLADPLEDAARNLLGFGALAAAALVHPLAAYRTPQRATVERTIALSLGGVGLLGAAASSLAIEPSSNWAPALGLAAVALLALAHVVVAIRTGAPRAGAPVLAGIGGAVAASVLVPVGFRMSDFSFFVIAPVVLAALVALALEFVARRTAASPARTAALVAAWAAGGVGALLLLVPLFTSFGPVAAVLELASPRWTYPADVAIALRPEHGWAVAALAVVTVVTAISWGLSGLLARRRTVLTWAVGVTLVLAVPLLGILWAIVVGWLVIAAAGVALLIARRASPVPTAAVAGIALVLGYVAPWSSATTWWWTGILAVAIIVAARWTSVRPVVRAIVSAVAAVVALVAAGSAGSYLNEYFVGGEGAALEATHAVAALAGVLVLVAALVPLPRLDARVLFWAGLAALVGAAGISWGAAATGQLPQLVFGEFGASAVLAGLAVISLVAWVLVPRTATLGPERAAASIALAPAAAWFVDSLVQVFRAPAELSEVAPIAAALVVAAGSLAATLRTGSDRWAREIGVAVVALPVLLIAAATRSDSAWIILLLGAVTALLLAVSADGVMRSESPRKYLGWLALALAAAGLWWRLADADFSAVEPYVLPLAGAVLLVAVWAWRAARPSAPWIALGGLLAGILPTAAAGTTGDIVRPIIVVAVSTLLLLGGSVAKPETARPWLDIAAIAGATGVVVGAFGRSIVTATERRSDDLSFDAWLAIGLVILVTAALMQARIPQRAELRTVLTQLMVGLALATILVFELAMVRDAPLGVARIGALVALFCVVHIVAFIRDRAPFSRIISWGSLGLAVIAAATGIALGIIDPLEWVTVPVAAALLTTGSWELARVPTTRSWAWLAPGLVVLLVPPLIATFVDTPAWRLVALGIASVTAIVVGALRKLQAPLLIGAVVVLVHALRTFAPGIRAIYEATQWWVWAVVAGAILLFLALTFEKRVRDLRAVTARVSELR